MYLSSGCGDCPATTAHQTEDSDSGSEFETPPCSEKGKKYKLICDDDWGLNCQ
ncbi:hypothetical protein I79_006478 [Cricetulus griseus]|uniref:Uncharacterized protein n=1 Tax=Cricetulus griseus TaxID=10029 RepID=G3H7Y2_CRIGR|nr:hypothetical protein I79_006478 [Cricetulus griseus]